MEKSRGLKDVEYGLFAQLSYLFWDKLDFNTVKEEDIYKKKDLVEFLKDRKYMGKNKKARYSRTSRKRWNTCLSRT